MSDEDIYSNLALISFSLNNFTWHSAEHYFQAAKFFDPEIIARIKQCQSPFRCAAIGQTRKYPIRDDWEAVKVSVMEQAIRARFLQHPALAEQLKRSKGRLFDHSAADDFWGIGFDGSGRNETGKILMKIRDELNRNR